MNLQFAMWVGSHKRLLGEVLRAVPPEVPWRLGAFDGIVRSGSPIRPRQSRSHDLPLSAADLAGLAASLEDLNEIRLLGRWDGVDVEVSWPHLAARAHRGAPEGLAGRGRLHVVLRDGGCGHRARAVGRHR